MDVPDGRPSPLTRKMYRVAVQSLAANQPKRLSPTRHPQLSAGNPKSRVLSREPESVTVRQAIGLVTLEDPMHVRYVAAMLSVLAVTMLVPASAAGQSPTWTPPRTPDGKPDIQGTFTFSTITPLQRPEALAGKDVLTAEEAAAFEASENKRLNRDLFDPEKGAPSAGYAPRSQGGVLSYNEFWYERGSQVTEDRRTSLIVDPTDGRIPFTAATRARNAELAARNNSSFADSYEDRSLGDRCLIGFNSGPPMISSTYNNNVQIFQTPGYVVIFNEMIHDARIIPTDGRPHGTLPRWTGDSRGRWEGDTLVVETINFRRETSLPGSSAATRLVERFTRVDPKTVRYEFTVTDPTTYTRPWTAVMPLRAIDEFLYEYACHEGNYGLRGILAGARAKDKAEAAKP
jgi:hypothetical protein